MQIFKINSNPQVQSLYDKIISHIVETIPSGLSNEKKIEPLYYYMIKHTMYDYEALSNATEDGNVFGSWIDGDLVQGTTASKYVVGIGHVGLCAGIALFFKDLCEAVNINCTLIEGKTRVINHETGVKLNHLWNLVEVEPNVFKHVDVTYGIFARDKKENPMDFCLATAEKLKEAGPHNGFDETQKVKKLSM